MISPIQCKMARAAVGWGVRDLAEKAGVGLATVIRFENEQREIRAEPLTAIERALEAAGVQFIPENGGGAGVRLKKLDPKGQ